MSEQKLLLYKFKINKYKKYLESTKLSHVPIKLKNKYVKLSKNINIKNSLIGGDIKMNTFSIKGTPINGQAANAAAMEVAGAAEALVTGISEALEVAGVAAESAIAEEQGIRPPVFYIYITGIFNNGNLIQDDDDLIYMLQEFKVLENLIRQIPEYFNISIQYYDNYSLNPEQRKYVSEFISKMRYVDRISISIYKWGDFDNTKIENKHHIVLDFAHIFKLTQNEGTAFYLPNGRDVGSPELTDIHILRVSPWRNKGRIILRDSKLLDFDEHFNVRTFFDRLLLIDPLKTFVNKSFILDDKVSEPIESINAIYNKIILDIENIIKGDKPLFQVLEETGKPELVNPIFKENLHIYILECIWQVDNINDCIHSLTEKGLGESLTYLSSKV